MYWTIFLTLGLIVWIVFVLIVKREERRKRMAFVRSRISIPVAQQFSASGLDVPFPYFERAMAECCKALHVAQGSLVLSDRLEDLDTTTWPSDDIDSLLNDIDHDLSSERMDYWEGRCITIGDVVELLCECYALDEAR